MSDQYENFQQINIRPDTQIDFPGYDFSQVTRNGGVMETRVSSGNDQGQIVDPSRRSSNVQVGLGGVTTVNSQGQVVSKPAVSTFNTAELTGNHTDFLATARNGFFPAQGRLNPDTIVTYQGIEATLANLEGMGVVSRTATGYVANQGVGQQQQQQQQQHQHQHQQQQTPPGLPEGTEYFPGKVESDFAAAIDPIPQPLYDQAVVQALVGGLDKINFNELSYHSNMTPVEARQRAEFIVEAFTAQANRIATDLGAANADDVWEWAEANHSEKFEDAKRQMVISRNTTAIRALVADYLKSVPTDIDSLKEAGAEVRKSASGETLIKVRGVWTTPAAAARARLLTKD